MVVATKRAVGAEYGYQVPSRFPQSPQRVRVRVRRRLSPVAGIAAGICLVAILFTIGLSYIYIKALKAQFYYQINVNKQAVLDISAMNEKLALEIARAKSLERIEYIASQKLGMIKNPEVQYLVLHDRSNTTPVDLPLSVAAAVEENPSGVEAPPGKKILMRLAMVFSRGSKVEEG